MANINQDLNTLKIFNQFLSILINRINQGDRVDESRVKELVSLIHTFMPNLKSKPQEKRVDQFLEKFISNDYSTRSSRNDSLNYNQFKNNLNFY